MESVTRRSKRIALKATPVTVNQKAKHICSNQNAVNIEIQSTDEQTNLSKLNSKKYRGKKSKKQEPVAITSEDSSSISTHNFPTSIGPNVDKMQLRRSERIAFKGSTLESSATNEIQLNKLPRKACKQKESKRTTDVNIGELPKKKLDDNGSNSKINAIVIPTTYEKHEIVMAKMSGHIIWPAKVNLVSFF